MSQKAKKFWQFWDRAGILLILVTVVIIFGLIDPNIIKPNQIATAVSRSAVAGIAAAGMMFAIVAGGFDLSIGSIVSLTSCIIAVQLTSGKGLPLALLTVAIAAVICGTVNGIIITKLKIQTFVATLATQLAFAGITLVYCSKAIMLTSKVNTSLKFFSTGVVLGIKMPIILLVLAYVITYFVYNNTSFGVKCRAVGSNEAAARTTGIKVDNTLISVFVVTALTAAMSGVLNTAQVSTGNPTLGAGFELDAITAVVLGGTALSGGKGNVVGTLVGAILVTFVKMGLNMLGAGEALQKIAVAAVLVFALTINGIRYIMQKGDN
jgi:ribose/xylose/arabinose/galactoside ABC-type transport system permease subunit